MSEQPKLVERDEVPYVSVPATVAMPELARAVDAGFPRVFSSLDANGISPAGPPFIRYVRIDMTHTLDIELGVPVPAGTPDTTGTLPAGRYVSMLHVGHYDELMAANATLQAWAADHGVAFAVTRGDDGDHWGARVEHYLTNPAEEPDPSRWQTEIAYLTV
jgi:effector-binding domain-containing protein